MPTSMGLMGVVMRNQMWPKPEGEDEAQPLQQCGESVGSQRTKWHWCQERLGTMYHWGIKGNLRKPNFRDSPPSPLAKQPEFGTVGIERRQFGAWGILDKPCCVGGRNRPCCRLCSIAINPFLRGFRIRRVSVLSSFGTQFSMVLMCRFAPRRWVFFRLFSMPHRFSTILHPFWLLFTVV